MSQRMFDSIQMKLTSGFAFRFATKAEKSDKSPHACDHKKEVHHDDRTLINEDLRKSIFLSTVSGAKCQVIHLYSPWKVSATKFNSRKKISPSLTLFQRFSVKNSDQLSARSRVIKLTLENEAEEEKIRLF